MPRPLPFGRSVSPSWLRASAWAAEVGGLAQLEQPRAVLPTLAEQLHDPLEPVGVHVQAVLVDFFQKFPDIHVREAPRSRPAEDAADEQHEVSEAPLRRKEVVLNHACPSFCEIQGVSREDVDLAVLLGSQPLSLAFTRGELHRRQG